MAKPMTAEDRLMRKLDRIEELLKILIVAQTCAAEGGKRGSVGKLIGMGNDRVASVSALFPKKKEK
jgi:hypothetical protein